jgi:amidohydrolase
MDFLLEAQRLLSDARQMRRDLHRHPELGFQETRTSAIIAAELARLGLDVSAGIAETGVVAILGGTRPGPTVLLRADIDALPISEQTGADYASLDPGVMHACGHDGHTAILLAVARLLHNQSSQLAGKVKFVFQPAEELMQGAARMVAEGVLGNPRPDYCLALHLDNSRGVGWLGISPGPIMAGADAFRIHIAGVGGHGAIPQLTRDPIVAAGQLVTALQSIVARNINPLDSGVVSVGVVRGGTAFNVIPPQVELEGTIRAYDPAVRETLVTRLRSIVQGIAASMGCTGEVEIQSLTPPVVNDPRLTNTVLDVAQEIFPQARIDTGFRDSASDDMAHMMRDIPGCYFFVGSANREAGLAAPHHDPAFDFDERSMVYGIALLSAAAVRLLQHGSSGTRSPEPDAGG